MLHTETGYSSTTISDILNALGNMVKDKFSECSDSVEIKIFPGLKIASKYMPTRQSVSKRLNIDSEYSIFMSAVFTDDFRKKVRKLHTNNGCRHDIEETNGT